MELTPEQRTEILERLDMIESKIDQIQRDLDVMMEIHELLHPHELERARREVRSNDC